MRDGVRKNNMEKKLMYHHPMEILHMLGHDAQFPHKHLHAIGMDVKKRFKGFP